MNSRLRVIDACAPRATQPLCDAVFAGLSAPRKSIPCRFFYDSRGSELFEQITKLPEYYLTRCEAEILERCAPAIVEEAGNDLTIVEFGSGSSAKTRRLLDAALNRQGHLEYVPIDISRDFLCSTAESLLNWRAGLRVTAVASEYSDAMEWLPEQKGSRLFLFLGSNIGNFCRSEAISFLGRVSAVMGRADRLLLGADLLKDRSVLRRAYNDEGGVTAEFNLNLLRRVNLELGATFDLSAFTHSAPFDEEHSRIEMQLISERQQRVFVEDLESSFTFEAGEPLVTEWSHKYTQHSICELAASADLEVVDQWTDAKAYFAEFLLRKKPSSAN